MPNGGLIEQPSINEDVAVASYSFEYPQQLNAVIEAMSARGLSQDSRVLDYCAGNGSVARALNDRGIVNVICIDYKAPNEPLVDLSYFMYVDLWELALSIARSEELPQKIESLRGTFDWMVGMQTFGLNWHCHRILGKFFLKPGGYIFPDDININDPDFVSDGIFYRYVPR